MEWKEGFMATGRISPDWKFQKLGEGEPFHYPSQTPSSTAGNTPGTATGISASTTFVSGPDSPQML